MPKHTVTRVKNSGELRQWYDFTGKLYPGRLFVPPLWQYIESLWKGKTPYNRDGDIAFYWICNSDGQVLARATLHTSRKFDEKMGRPVQLFGYAEFVDDYDVFIALFDYLADSGRKHGRQALFGPANLLPNQSGGVISSGFGKRGFIDSVYNHAYYQGHYLRYGLKSIFPGRTYLCESIAKSNLDAEAIFLFDKNRMTADGLSIQLVSPFTFSRSVKSLHALLNDSFRVQPFYCPISLEELNYQLDPAKFIMRPELFFFLTRHGKPIAFILALPDVSDFVLDEGGDIGLWQQLKIFLNRRRYQKEVVLIVKGTSASETGKGYMGLLSQVFLKHLRKLGVEKTRVTWVGEDNPASASQFLKMGGHILHELSFYQLEL